MAPRACAIDHRSDARRVPVAAIPWSAVMPPIANGRTCPPDAPWRARRSRRRVGAGRCCRGMTLLETVFALAIGAALMALALPSFGDWMQAYSLASHAQYLAGHLNRARSEAIRRGHRVN